jgi:hypothetical protein
MQLLWCWRCRMEVPMLDEEEFAEVARLHSEAVQNTKHFREGTGSDLKHPKIADLFRPVRDKYEQLTGVKESNENAIMHHRLALYGPPCERCGKPLRTPTAKLCGNCMLPMHEGR